MSDGKHCVKRDVVILSIKPRRPEYPSDKKYILAKEASRICLQEWDKLDAYYRGQILKLKTQAKSHASRKSSSKSSSGGKKSSSCSSSSLTRRSSSGHQLTELFGENIPFDDNDLELELSEDENTKPTTRHHHSNNKQHNNNDIKKLSSEKKSHRSRPTSLQLKKHSEDDENYLSVPRDNFVIEFAISLKKRTPLHRPDHCNAGFLSPIKVEPYKPPVAIGFNGVHIQKILYHKSDGVNNTSPTTTAPTPEKPPDNESAASPLLINTNNESKRESDTSISNKGLDNGNDSQLYSGNKVSEKICNNKVTEKRTTMSPPILKRKLGQSDSNNNNGPVSSTTSMSEDHLEIIPAKKPANDKSKPTLTSSLSDKNSNNTLMETKGYESRKSLSITDKIIKKAMELPPDLKERERRRKLEIQKRKIYALEKGDEQKLLDSLDVSMKAFEMIWNGRIVSPLRSPPI